ncbi:MAG: type II toxin-antitoxin system Phd/YefM family antitoxin [Armatimonadetes bacterium]|nr:type II toxin-antitoxin system Phd/YefM family antitoxin [Armatimonadota bacterium]
MTSVTATEAKARFGEYMEKARHEPVVVNKTGRRYVVMISAEEHDRLQALEDAYWAARAAEAERGGFIGADAAAGMLRRATDAE